MAKSSIYLDTRRKTKDGKYPLKLRVTYNRKSKYFPTEIYLEEDILDNFIRGKYLNDKQKKERLKLEKIQDKLDEIIESMDVFSFDALQERFHRKGKANDLLEMFRARIEKNRQNGKIGTANIDQDTLKALNVFLRETKPKIENHTLLFDQITPAWLKKFEAWNFERGISHTTVHIRNIRIKAAINEAIQLQLLDARKYPYGKGKYQAPRPSNKKRALLKEELEKLTAYKPKNENERFAKDFWFFSFLSSGMNLGDIFLLKWSNFSGKDSFTFRRRKSKKEGSVPVDIKIELNPNHWKIIDRQGSRKIDPNSFVFDVVSHGMDPEKEYDAIKNAINKVNNSFRKISKSLGFSFSVTSYHARHTYASQLMREAPIAYISKQLGHRNISTTENYLGNFTSEEAKKYEENLLPRIEIG
jgi:Site-specific recombinase XerD